MVRAAARDEEPARPGVHDRAVDARHAVGDALGAEDAPRRAVDRAPTAARLEDGPLRYLRREPVSAEYPRHDRRDLSPWNIHVPGRGRAATRPRTIRAA